MTKRHLPVYPNLNQLRHQAKELLDEYRRGNPEAIEEFCSYHPQAVDLDQGKLADAQLVLARSYGVASWPRLVHACQMTDAIQRDDLQAVRQLITDFPDLLFEDARGVPGNWGPPMSYAANLGRNRIIQMLASHGAKDIQHAFDRACLQGQIETARWLVEQGAKLERGIVMGACETQNADGLRLLLELGAEVCDAHGDALAPLAMVLETYSRSPAGKHACLELMVRHGVELPDSPMMAFHRGRIDLLDGHLRRDPQLVSRTFSYREIYPLELGCHADESLGLHGTPLDGTTLLHLCVDFDELEIARWLLKNGANVNARATIDKDGFGGHTPLFNAVVSQAHTCGRQRDAAMIKLLLTAGADVSARASIRKRLRFVDDESVHTYVDVTPLEYGNAFHAKRWTNQVGLQLIAEQGRT